MDYCSISRQLAVTSLGGCTDVYRFNDTCESPTSTDPIFVSESSPATQPQKLVSHMRDNAHPIHVRFIESGTKMIIGYMDAQEM